MSILAIICVWLAVGLAAALFFGALAHHNNAKDESLFSNYREDTTHKQ